jgi:multiple sugar transport system permease protein
MPTLDHFRSAFFGGRSIVPYLVNSALIAGVSTLVATALGAMAAYGLARFDFRGNRQLGFWILSTRMAPPVAFLVPMFLLAREVRMIDTHLFLIVVYTSMNLSFVTWVLIGFFREIPIELEESARIDGYSRWDVFVRVAFPLVRPGLAATAILSAIFAWNEFLFALILTSKSAATIPIYLAGFSESMGIAWGEFMAVGCFAVVPIMVFTVALQKHLVRGLTFGAVK